MLPNVRPIDEKHFETLDTLLPDGSIVWSNRRYGSSRQSAREANCLLSQQRENNPPQVDPQGVAAFEKLEIPERKRRERLSGQAAVQSDLL